MTGPESDAPSAGEQPQSLNEERSTANSQLQEKVEELQQRNQDLTNLLNRTDICALILDPHLCIRLFTPAGAHLFRLHGTDTGRPLADFSPGFSDADLLADAAAVLEDLVPREQEVRTDEGRHLLRRILPYRNGDNRIDGVVITCIDITVRIREEQALRDLNRELEMCVASRTHDLEQKTAELGVLADNVPSQYAYVDAGQVYRYVNRLYEKRFGLPVDRILGKTVRDLLGPELYPIAKPYIDGVLAGRPQRYEHRFNFPEGARVMDVLYEPDLAEDGSTRGFFVLVHDITERKQLEEALFSSQSHLKAIIDAAADGIITVNSEGIVRDFNPAAEHIFGVSTDSIVGRNAHQLLAPHCEQCPEYPVCLFTGRCPQGSAHPRELTARHQDGRQFPIEITASTIDHLGLTAILIRDISERRELEREVIDAATVEQARIGREIHDSIGQQLTALSMLAGGISKKLHDRGRTDEATEIDRLVEHLQTTLDQAHRLAQGLAPVEIDPAGLSNSLHQLARDIRESGGIECSFHDSSGTLVDDSDTALHLYRIAQEAVNNALKHGKPQRVDIHFDRSDHALELTIRDDGSGIRESDQRHGHLGLHLMRYRAGIIGGELHVESPAGGGTRVSCTIPVH